MGQSGSVASYPLARPPAGRRTWSLETEHRGLGGSPALGHDGLPRLDCSAKGLLKPVEEGIGTDEVIFVPTVPEEVSSLDCRT